MLIRTNTVLLISYQDTHVNILPFTLVDLGFYIPPTANVITMET